jgi:tyrosyl-tRNA synthetase
VNRFFERGQAYASKHRRGQTDRGKLDILNNLDWTGQITLLDFLKGVGKRSKVNAMLARDR